MSNIEDYKIIKAIMEKYLNEKWLTYYEFCELIEDLAGGSYEPHFLGSF